MKIELKIDNGWIARDLDGTTRIYDHEPYPFLNGIDWNGGKIMVDGNGSTILRTDKLCQHGEAVHYIDGKVVERKYLPGMVIVKDERDNGTVIPGALYMQIFGRGERITTPEYYNSGPYETRKVAEAWDLHKDAYLFNALKYISRAGKKPGEDLKKDLKKAIDYLQWRIDLEEKEQ